MIETVIKIGIEQTWLFHCNRFHCAENRQSPSRFFRKRPRLISINLAKPKIRPGSVRLTSLKSGQAKPKNRLGPVRPGSGRFLGLEGRWISTFYSKGGAITIFSERELTSLYAIARPSVCRLSVVCNVRAPYSGGSNFRQYFYGIRYLGHPLTSTENFTEIVPGKPLGRGS